MPSEDILTSMRVAALLLLLVAGFSNNLIIRDVE